MIRAYDPADDELIAEHELGRMTLRELVEVLGFAPTQLGSTPLTEEQVRRFADPLDSPADYFLDFDADGAQVRRADVPDAVAAF
ncbi:MAG: hypothetical protein IRZ32_02645 [Solirubrobacteraceae bacterium]|nr:hypothetical protein [Solirubrobacteraceae bacterium]